MYPLVESHRRLIPYISSSSDLWRQPSHSLWDIPAPYDPLIFFFMTLPTHLNKWFMIVAVSHKMNTQKFLLSVYYVQGSVVTKRFLASGCISCMEKRHWITTGKNQEEGLWFYPVSLSQTFLVKSLFLH